MGTFTSTSTSLTPGARLNADLTNELEKLKLQQAIAKAQSGQTTGESPGQLQAARLAAALQQQQAAAGSNQALQTQRLATNSSDLIARMNLQRQAQGDAQLGQKSIQADRLQSTERLSASQLAAQMQRQQSAQQSQKDLQTNASTLDEQRKKDAATRALALFRSAPGTQMSKLNTAGARAELG